MGIDEKASESVFQKFKYVKPRLNRAAIDLICSSYEAAKAPATDQPDECTNWVNLEPRYGVICGSWNKEGDLALCNECLESPAKTSQDDFKTAFELQKAASDGFKKMYEDLQAKYHSLEEECYGLHEGTRQLRAFALETETAPSQQQPASALVDSYADGLRKAIERNRRNLGLPPQVFPNEFQAVKISYNDETSEIEEKAIPYSDIFKPASALVEATNKGLDAAHDEAKRRERLSTIQYWELEAALEAVGFRQHTREPDVEAGARAKFLDDVAAEVARARAKFPEGRHFIPALSEEHGELSNALLEQEYGKGVTSEMIYKEAVQVAAMAMRIGEEGVIEFPKYNPPATSPQAGQ